MTAQACAANASLASIRSRSSIFQPAFFSAAREAGIGPVPMIAGSTPACAQETMRASGVLPRLAASLAFISTTAAAPSLMPEALAAVTVPSLSKAGRSLAIESRVAPCLRIFVGVDHHVALARLDGHRHDLVLERPAFMRRLGLVLRGDRELVLLLRG